MDFSDEHLRKLLEIHGKFEFANDIDGVMSTVSEDPSWEVHPLGMKIDGRDAVRDYYRLSCSLFVPRPSSRAQRVMGYSEMSVLFELAYRFPEGDSCGRDGCAVIILDFDAQGLARSERLYGSGTIVPIMAEIYAPLWGRPGISRMFP